MLPFVLFFLEYHRAEETDIGRNVPNKVIMIHEQTLVP